MFINFAYSYEDQDIIQGKISNFVAVTVASKEEQLEEGKAMEKEDIEAADKQLLDYYAS